MASLPASPRGDIFPCYSTTDTEEHRNRRGIDKRRDIPCYNREMLAYQNLIKCWLALFLKMLLKAPRMADGGGASAHIHTTSFSLSHRHREIHCSFSVSRGKSLHVYHDDPCHEGAALNKTRVIGGGEDARLQSSGKQRPFKPAKSTPTFS